MASPTDILVPNSSLLDLLRDFDRDAVESRGRIGEYAKNQPDVFCQAAVEVLKKDPSSRGAQFVVTLLVSRNLLFQILRDPTVDRDLALAVSRQALAADPRADIALARQLAEDTDFLSTSEGMKTAERVMGILEQISEPSRILPSLMRVLRDNAYLRSKAVLMIGQGGKGLSWIRRYLDESDPRVRANAVEALWSTDTAETREILGAAVRDNNNRVASNALLGLYWLGDNAALSEMVKMANHQSPAFRRSAAWIMGQTGDLRFTEIIGRMLVDSQPEVRKSAFAAVRQLKTAVAKLSQTSSLVVAGSASIKEQGDGQRRVSVAVLDTQGRESPRLLPTQFILTENGQPVWTYRVTERPAAQPMSVIFLFPHSLEVAGKLLDHNGLRGLAWKRAIDQWSSARYSPDAELPSADQFELPSFIANTAKTKRPSQEKPKREDATGFWKGLRRAVEPENIILRGKRQIIAVCLDDAGALPDEGLIAALQAARFSLQVVSVAENAALEDFCRRLAGNFQRVQDVAVLEERISLAYLNLLARYEIRYQPVYLAATTLKIRVQAPTGWSEASVPFA